MREEEAERKWCPQWARLDAPNRCIGSHCMAWRWLPLECSEPWKLSVRVRAEETGEKPPFAKSARYVNENRAEFGLPEKPFEGYCGLAGKPE